jgi:L-alanine-DL-glutamate epimerase-like enolase superfamily enzyme
MAQSSILSLTAECKGLARDVARGHVICPNALVRPELLDQFIRPALIGQDVFMRERLWQKIAHRQRGSAGQLSDRTLAVVDLALWDAAGQAVGLPVWKMIGGYRDKLPAYGSIMCGDEVEGGLKTPQDYARYALWLVKRGYHAIKLHTWMPPVSFAPSVDMDIAACAAVREAVGPDFPLMLDASHWYSRSEALRLGRAIEKLNFLWYEEPMDEASMGAYQWMSNNLGIDVLGPESAGGKHHTRAEWLRAGACDILRTGVHDVGGLTPALKCMHLAESFYVNCEVHGTGIANLTLSAVSSNCKYYERGLLHPFLDYDKVPEYLTYLPDEMDEQGYVHLNTTPGFGDPINWDWVKDHTVSTH